MVTARHFAPSLVTPHADLVAAPPAAGAAPVDASFGVEPTLEEPLEAPITVIGMTDASRTADLDGLHAAILDAWNRQDARAYAACFVDDALVIGFDGSEMRGRVAIAEQLGGIFSDHEVATYVRVVRSVRRLDERTELLHAVVGMVPPGGDDVMPDRHAVQLLVGTRESDRWRAVSFQNTPALLHGRREALDALTADLRKALPR